VGRAGLEPATITPRKPQENDKADIRTFSQPSRGKAGGEKDKP